MTFSVMNATLCSVRKCWVRKHRDEQKQSHVALELNDVMALNKNNIDKSLRNLKELSVKVDTVIQKRTREMQEKDDELTNFCTEVQRLLMCGTRERYVKNLHTIRNEIATSNKKKSGKCQKKLFMRYLVNSTYLRGYKALTKWRTANSMKSGQILTFQTH